jgi:hypothetical protein
VYLGPARKVVIVGLRLEEASLDAWAPPNSPANESFELKCQAAETNPPFQLKQPHPLGGALLWR